MEHSKIKSGRDFIIANIKCRERQIIFKKEKRSRMQEAGSRNSASMFAAPAAC